MNDAEHGYRVRFVALRVALFPRWRSAPAWRVRCGYRSSSPSLDVKGYCDDARRVIGISPGLTGNELDTVIVHEIVHAVAGPGHTRRFVARMRTAADAARAHGLADLAEALCTEAAAYERLVTCVMDNRKTDAERIVQKLLSLPRREQAICRRLLIRMFNTDTPRSYDEWIEIANAELRRIGPPPIKAGAD